MVDLPLQEGTPQAEAGETQGEEEAVEAEEEEAVEEEVQVQVREEEGAPNY